MSSDNKIEIKRLDPKNVVSPVIGPRPHLKIIGSNFSDDMYVYACKKGDGTQEVADITIDKDESTESTDRQWCVVVTPQLGAAAGDLYVAIKLDGKFQDAEPGLKVV
ncbi:hypothetical protein A6U87_22370 [Rhizobium sp. AC44/96]|jgi:hypothetical protein|uniref:hypothetical protein n=1 Tax=Rhizobium sp. AC44/96 TaxID=1841654 RepID=UPI00080FC8DC|nr:hypothetical protein [Rhizobium sp. AC44/96]OCJ16368.1 hypothetical protein A6U87_22370 [Rhizobium sp. AC44/96]